MKSKVENKYKKIHVPTEVPKERKEFVINMKQELDKKIESMKNKPGSTTVENKVS